MNIHRIPIAVEKRARWNASLRRARGLGGTLWQ